MFKLIGFISIGFVLGSALVYLTMKEVGLFDFTPYGYTRVTVRNETGHDIAKVALTGLGEINAISKIKDKEEFRFAFKSYGENVISVNVVLDNGQSLTSEEEYFESGYRITATVKGSEIVMDYR